MLHDGRRIRAPLAISETTHTAHIVARRAPMRQLRTGRKLRGVLPMLSALAKSHDRRDRRPPLAVPGDIGKRCTRSPTAHVKHGYRDDNIEQEHPQKNRRLRLGMADEPDGVTAASHTRHSESTDIIPTLFQSISCDFPMQSAATGFCFYGPFLRPRSYVVQSLIAV